MNAIQELNK